MHLWTTEGVKWNRRSRNPMRRFTFVALIYAVTVSCEPVRSVRLSAPVPVADCQGDTWVAAWAKDGSLYSPSDDSEGFHKVGSANIVFNRIDGETR